MFPESIARPVKPENINKSGGNGKSLFMDGSKVVSGYYDDETSAARFFIQIDVEDDRVD